MMPVMDDGVKATAWARPKRRLPVILGLLLVAGMALLWFARSDDGQARELEAIRYIEAEIATQNRLIAHGYSRYDAHDVRVAAGPPARIGGHYVSCATTRSKAGADRRAKPALVADTVPIIERPKEPASFGWLRARLGCATANEAASES